MRIGVVSDTHDNALNISRIVELFNEAAVERVVHTGDITRAETLHALAELHAPLFAVFGNNDVDRDGLTRVAAQHGIHLVDPPLVLTWHGRTIAVVHDPDDLTVELREQHDLLLYGHVHRHVHERDNGAVVFNPGECSGGLKGQNRVGIVDLESLEPELLFF